MSDKDLARDVEIALEKLPAPERDQLESEGTRRSSEDLMTLGLAA